MTIEYPTDFLGIIINYILICLPIYYLSAYVFCRTQSINKLRALELVYILISGIVFTILFNFVRLNNSVLSYFLFYLIVPIAFSLLIREREKFFETLVVGLVSISLIFVLDVIATFIQSIVFWILGLSQCSVFVQLISQLLILVLLCMLFLSLKRFRKGIQYFQEKKNIGIGLAISAIVMILKCIDLREGQGKVYLFIVFVIGIIIAGFGLYLWIKRSITAHYREKLQLQSEEHYQKLLAEREQENEKLNQTNEYLAKIVHRDNHLMNSLNTAIDSYFYSDDTATKNVLFREIQTMVKERGELIGKEQRESKILPSCGIQLIDNTINDLFIKAAAHGIEFDMTVSMPVSEVIGKYISQTDLQTLLSDHIKDAMIAVESRGEEGGKVLVDLSAQNESYCISIYDSGAEFDIDTLSKLGLERVTTHADSGGSGIGFVTTFETLRKVYASLIINEFENQTPFSKSVNFRFDGENSFIIQSYRSAKLKERIHREDVVII